jgi:anti-anti-sigma regulatory factor
MALELSRADGEWSLTISGVVDVFEARALHALAVQAAAAPALAVRLGAAESFDTSATQILIALRRALAADGRAFRLEGTTPAVDALWRLAGIDTALT